MRFWPRFPITEEMNNILTTTFTKEEVEKALKQMKPLKSPGPDGIPHPHPHPPPNFSKLLVFGGKRC